VGGVGECSTWNVPLLSLLSCGALRCLLACLAVDPDGHGAVVRQGYLHIGAEATRADGAPESLLEGVDNLIVEGLGDLGTGGTNPSSPLGSFSNSSRSPGLTPRCCSKSRLSVSCPLLVVVIMVVMALASGV